ncbi:MAG: FGGY family carbohydrate kinase [Hyphomicrobiales bacterium]
MLVGIDVGTTAVKAALLDETGTSLRQHVAPYGTNRPHPGHVEQNPADWMKHVLASLAAFDGASIAGVGLCSQVNTHVFVDAQGQALLPAMTWQDVRCASVASELDGRVSIADKITWWGAPLPIDASHVLARMLYAQRHHPEEWKNTRWVMAPKDYCIFHLTGKVTADPMTCFGLVDQNLQPIAALIDLVVGAEERLPPILRFHNIGGPHPDGPALRRAHGCGGHGCLVRPVWCRRECRG